MLKIPSNYSLFYFIFAFNKQLSLMAMKLNKLKGLFIVEEEQTQNPEEKKTEEQKTDSKKTDETVKSKVSWESSSSKNSEVTNTTFTTNTTETTGKFNQKIFDSLMKAISDQNLPGEDYLEFMDALKAMKDLPLEESLKMKTVFMTLSTKGLTIQKILDSAGIYTGILNKEKEKFYQAMDAQKNQNINNKKKQITDYEAKNKEKADMIKKLTDEIAFNNSEIQKISIEINMGESKIKSTENDFIYTFDKISNQIAGDVEKIKQINTQ
jgi:hypothetical protein